MECPPLGVGVGIHRTNKAGLVLRGIWGDPSARGVGQLISGHPLLLPGSSAFASLCAPWCYSPCLVSVLAAARS